MSRLLLRSVALILVLAQLVAAPATVFARESGQARPDTLARATLTAAGSVAAQRVARIAPASWPLGGVCGQVARGTPHPAVGNDAPRRLHPDPARHERRDKGGCGAPGAG